MNTDTIIKGFSRLSTKEKISMVAKKVGQEEEAEQLLSSFHHPDEQVQKVLSAFSENTISNFPMPYGVAPNFLINGKMYMVPMVIEESSVVAAAASAAGFWAARGGFHARVTDVEKNGQLHFLYSGEPGKLQAAFPEITSFLRERSAPLEENMKRRGGGIRELELKDYSEKLPHYFQLHVTFDTVDAMGANFINSILECYAECLGDFFKSRTGFHDTDYEPLMAILSNYTPGCIAEVMVECPLEQLGEVAGLGAKEFGKRFDYALAVASMDVYRATTHNKGIMNGVDAVVLATGNDFRAIEAAAHAYASRSGSYTSLSHASVTDTHFRFSLSMPMAVGTLGGLTSLHPLSALSLKILGNPDARELMMIAAAAGLANNFSAVRSLVTTGIQAGHMKLHLPNILHQLQANEAEKEKAMAFFKDRKVSHRAVADFLAELRARSG